MWQAHYYIYQSLVGVRQNLNCRGLHLVVMEICFVTHRNFVFPRWLCARFKTLLRSGTLHRSVAFVASIPYLGNFMAGL